MGHVPKTTLFRTAYSDRGGSATCAKDPACDHEKRTVTKSNSASLRFEQLKALAGEWEVTNSGGFGPKGKILARYHLTAGGSAVVETTFPGEPMEMITVYHRDGDQLMLTHYCHLGNQPRMRTKSVSDDADLVFDYVGGNCLDPATETHMHDMKMRLVDADHFHMEWELYKDGKGAGVVRLDLVRKK